MKSQCIPLNGKFLWMYFRNLQILVRKQASPDSVPLLIILSINELVVFASDVMTDSFNFEVKTKLEEH